MVIWGIWNSVRERGNTKRLLRALEWPEVQGVVARSRVVWAHAEVNYTYSVAGGSYKGKCKINLTPQPPDRYSRGAARLIAESKGTLAEFPDGSDVVVRYNPANPGESILWCGGDVRPGSVPDTQTTGPDFLVLK